ncbi:hypothetical protein ACKGJI_04215 [Sulfurospirillum sp. 1307]
MYTNLFAIDPMAGISYGIYNSIKGEKGSFLDFLFHYDSYKANNNENDWLNDLMSEDVLSYVKNPKVLSSLNYVGLSTIDFFSTKSYFDTKVEVLKLQLLQKMSYKLNEFSPCNDSSKPIVSLSSSTLEPPVKAEEI